MAEMLKVSDLHVYYGSIHAVGVAGHHSTAMKAVPSRKKEA